MVVAVPDIHGQGKTINNMQECRARGAPVIAIATAGDNAADRFADDIIRVPSCADFIAPAPVVVAEQLLAYYIARRPRLPIDQPRNLAQIGDRGVRGADAPRAGGCGRARSPLRAVCQDAPRAGACSSRTVCGI